MLMAAKEVEVPIYLDALDLAGLDLSKKVRVGGNVYLVKRVKAPLPLRGRMSMVTLVRV